MSVHRLRQLCNVVFWLAVCAHCSDGLGQLSQAVMMSTQADQVTLSSLVTGTIIASKFFGLGFSLWRIFATHRFRALASLSSKESHHDAKVEGERADPMGWLIHQQARLESASIIISGKSNATPEYDVARKAIMLILCSVANLPDLPEKIMWQGFFVARVALNTMSIPLISSLLEQNDVTLLTSATSSIPDWLQASVARVAAVGATSPHDSGNHEQYAASRSEDLNSRE